MGRSKPIGCYQNLARGARCSARCVFESVEGRADPGLPEELWDACEPRLLCPPPMLETEAQEPFLRGSKGGEG